MAQPPEQASIPAIMAPPRERDNPLTRSVAGVIGIGFLAFMMVACLFTLPWTLGTVTDDAGNPTGLQRFEAGDTRAARLPPVWLSPNDEDRLTLNALVDRAVILELAAEHQLEPDQVVLETEGPIARELRAHWPTREQPLFYMLGTDQLGRSLFVRVLAGGGISLTIGIAAALLSVFIGTIYGAISAYAGGKTDAVMMRIVDILYGLPYILLVVLLAVASDAALDEYIGRGKERAAWVQQQATQIMASEQGAQPGAITAGDVDRFLEQNDAIATDLAARALAQIPPRQVSERARMGLDVGVLLIAIGGVSWLTLARVVRGQVLSLKNQPFIEAARAMGAKPQRIFIQHLLPNLVGPIVVYATLAVPQAILQESFLSFLGIGVKPPLPSWGNLAADGLGELNTHESHWWLLLFPCVLLGSTLLALNFVGEGLREAFDPKRARR